MGKKKAVKPWRAAKEQSAQPNAFERIHNRKKFDVLGKKQKGERKHGKARSDAVTKRKHTLLVEYRGMQRSNAFVDQRFGEEDSSLTAEDKAIARFQKQRMKELKGDKFALLDEDEEQLTHLGRSLADDDFKADGDRQLMDDDDGDAMLDDRIVRDFHFGGGFVQKKKSIGAGDADEEAPEPRKSKKEVMEELIAKSKAGKAAKQMQKEEDLTATDVLDASFQSLLQAGGLSALLREKVSKHDRQGAQKARPQDNGDAEFDRVRRELAFESRAKVSDRTKTAEELAELERLRLEALEKQRLRRMTAAASAEKGDADEADAVPAQATGGYAARRQKRQKLSSEAEADIGPSGDALDDNIELSGDEDDGDEDDSQEVSDDDSEEDATATRRAQQASGSHPLQQSFKAAAGELLKKYGIAPDDAEEGDIGEGVDEDEEEDPEAADTEDESGEISEQEPATDEAETDAEDENEAEAEEEKAEAEEEEEDDQESGAEPAPDQGAPGQQEGTRAASGQDASTSGQARAPETQELPYTIAAPESYEDFASLVAGRSAADLSAAIQRIMACNSAALATANRRKLQVLYGILVQHFANLAGQAPLPIAHLEALTKQLLELTAEVPFYAATVARARLSRLQQRLDSALSDPDRESSLWPTTRALLLLKLWATLYPVSDRRHPVLTPAAILVGAHLALCRLTSASDIPRGLYLSSLALHMAGPAQRFAPEPLNFAVRILESVCSDKQGPLLHNPNPPFTSAAEWLDLDRTAQHATSEVERLQPLKLSEVLTVPPEDAYFGSRAFQCSVISAAVELASKAAELYADLAALPEALAPAQQALTHIAGFMTLPQGLLAQVERARTQLAQASRQCLASRKPLVRRSATKAPEIRLLNPRFEEEYAAGKDFDPDRERAAAKHLRRQLQKEKRGAMRELRKDAVFLGEVRERDRAAAAAERRSGMRANMAFLEQQEADFKSGGQGGIGKYGKKGRGRS